MNKIYVRLVMLLYVYGWTVATIPVWVGGRVKSLRNTLSQNWCALIIFPIEQLKIVSL